MLWGQTFATSVEARDAQGKVMSPTPSLQWTSSADGIATVDNTGRIHTIRRGHTTITAKSGNASASIEVDVTGFSELGQASFETTCAVTDDHLDIYCWGNGANNRITPKHAAKAWHYPSLIQIQLGDIPAGTKITSLMTGTWSTCALTEAGKAYCSGEPNNGLTLGSGDNAAKPVLTAVQNGDIPAGVKTTALASSADNMCATGSDSQLYCWGSTDPLPVNAKTPRFPSLMKPTRMERGDIPQGATLSAIGVGISGGCAIANGEAYCWHLRLAPKLVARGEVPANVKLTDISVTDDITCAAGDDGRAYCLGQAFGRRFGAGKAAFVEAKDWNAVSLGEMPAGVKVKQITVGGIANVSCILGDDHKAYCWGKNTRGSIGNGDQKEADVLEPKQVAQGQVPSDVSLLQITCAQAYCAVLGDDGRIYSWGSSTNDFVLGRAVNLGSSGPQLLNAPLP
jgi:alpha-tubulin suppressor-like RCC1 family protein